MAENKKSSISKKSGVHLMNVKQPERTSHRIKLSFQRTKATLCLLKTDTKVDAAMGLVDISEAGAGFFTASLLLKGASVEVSLIEPRLLKIKGMVAWSVPVKSGVLGAKFPFRTGVQFILDNEIQRIALQEYIKRVQTDPLESAMGLSAPSTGEAQTVVASQEAPPANDVAAPTAAAEQATAQPVDASVTQAGEAPAPTGEAPPSGEAPATESKTPSSDGSSTPAAA